MDGHGYDVDDMVIRAVIENKYGELEELLRKKSVSINVLNYGLKISGKYGCLDIFRLLQLYGSNDYYTAAIKACKNGHLNIVTYILDNNYLDSSKLMMLLIESVLTGYYHLIDFLLIKINKLTQKEIDLLYVNAVKNGRLNVINYLRDYHKLDVKVDIIIENSSKYGYLYIIEYHINKETFIFSNETLKNSFIISNNYGHKHISDFLLKLNNKNQFLTMSDLNTSFKNSSINGDVDMLEYLYLLGANNIKDALDAAIFNNRPSSINYLTTLQENRNKNNGNVNDTKNKSEKSEKKISINKLFNFFNLNHQ